MQKLTLNNLKCFGLYILYFQYTSVLIVSIFSCLPICACQHHIMCHFEYNMHISVNNFKLNHFRFLKESHFYINKIIRLKLNRFEYFFFFYNFHFYYIFTFLLFFIIYYCYYYYFYIFFYLLFSLFNCIVVVHK